MKCSVELVVSPYGGTADMATVWLYKNRAIYTLALQPELATEIVEVLGSLPLDQGIYPAKGAWYCYDGFVEEGPYDNIETALKALKTQVMLSKKAQAERL